jgi:heavy-metal exporter, HME family
MTLGGIAIAVGELVDDAVVDVENMSSALAREPRAATAAPGPAGGRFRERWRSVPHRLCHGMIIVLVFLPLFALSGIEGRLFAPLGIAYIVSILASLLVAVTVTPVLCYLAAAEDAADLGEHEGWLVRKF